MLRAPCRGPSWARAAALRASHLDTRFPCAQQTHSKGVFLLNPVMACTSQSTFTTSPARSSRKSKAQKNQARARARIQDKQPKPKPRSKTKSDAPEPEAVQAEAEAKREAWTTLAERMARANPKRPPIGDDEMPEMAGPDVNVQSLFIQDADPAGVTAKGKSPTQPARKSRKGTAAGDGILIPESIQFTPVHSDDPMTISKLQHGLDKVLFNPGVYQIRDHRSGVYNFDPAVTKIMPNDEFDFNALGEYITSSKDQKLRQLAAEHGSKYCGSTSSMTSILSHFHYLLSHWKKPSFRNLSQSIQPETVNFTALTRGPAAGFLKLKDGIYALDADKEFDSDNVLSLLGRSMEKLLTLSPEKYEKYRQGRSHELPEDSKDQGEQYHYTSLGDFMMRSQLDAYDPRLPGTGVFDLKTRAVVTIRMDVTGYKKGVGYEIRRRFGQWESFDREYMDMIRAAFLKYSLQVRMGRMDGIFVAYHNTERIFGFQYIPLEEMDEAIHGTNNRKLGDQEFRASVSLLNVLLEKATKKFPGRSLRLHVETRPTVVPITYFFAEPVSEEEIASVQERSKKTAEKLGERLQSSKTEKHDGESLDLHDHSAEESAPGSAGQAEKAEEAWASMMGLVDDALDDVNLGLPFVKQAMQDILVDDAWVSDASSGVLTDASQDLALALAEVSTSHQLRATPEDDRLSEARIEQESREEEEEESESSSNVEAAERSGEDAGVTPDLSVNTQDFPVRGTNDFFSPLSLGERSLKYVSLKMAIAAVAENIHRAGTGQGKFERMFLELVSQHRGNGQSNQASTSVSTSEAVETQESKAAQAETQETAEESQEAEEVGSGQASEGETTEAPAPDSRPHGPGEILGLCISATNNVNGDFVREPQIKSCAQYFDWRVHYRISELNDDKAREVYAQMRRRRKTIFNVEASRRSQQWHHMFGGRLPKASKAGETFRQKVDKSEMGQKIQVAWNEQPVSFDAATKSS